MLSSCCSLPTTLAPTSRHLVLLHGPTRRCAHDALHVRTLRTRRYALHGRSSWTLYIDALHGRSADALHTTLRRRSTSLPDALHTLGTTLCTPTSCLTDPLCTTFLPHARRSHALHALHAPLSAAVMTLSRSLYDALHDPLSATRCHDALYDALYDALHDALSARRYARRSPRHALLLSFCTTFSLPHAVSATHCHDALST
jgi:hypothetical protein